MDRIKSLIQNPLKTYFERVLGEVVQNFLAQFIDGQLVTSLSSLNSPELHNIFIAGQKADNFNKKFMIDSPFDLVSAKIQDLKLNVPLSRIYVESVVIKCTKVHLVLKVKNQYSYADYRAGQLKKLEKMKNDNVSDAEKKKTFFDELLHNIFNKMQVDVRDLVVQILFDDVKPANQDQFNIMLKVISLKKTYTEDHSMNHGMDSSLMTSGSIMGQEYIKTIEQNFSLEIRDISLHLLNKLVIDIPEYINIPKESHIFPWSWPNQRHPSTVLFLEEVLGTLEVAFKRQLKNQMHEREWIYTNKLKIPSALQIQLEPYQLKLILRSIKPLQSFFNLKKNHEMHFKAENDGEQIIESFVGPGIDIEEIEDMTESFKQASDDQLFQSVVNFSVQSMQEDRRVASKLKGPDIRTNTYTERHQFQLNLAQLNCILFKQSPTILSEMGLQNEFARLWRKTAGQNQYVVKKINHPASSLQLRVKKLYFFLKQMDGQISQIDGQVQTVKLVSENLVSKEKQESAIFHSAGEKYEKYLTPAFNIVYNKRSLNLQEYQAFDSFYKRQLILLMGPQIKTKKLGVLENLQQFPFGIRKKENDEYINLQKYGHKLKQTDMYMKQQSHIDISQPILQKQEESVISYSLNECAQINISRLQGQFSFELLADIDNILNPVKQLQNIQHLIQPITVIPLQSQYQVTTKQLTFSISIQYFRLVWNTWKLRDQMENYEIFNEHEIIQMHDQTRCHLGQFPDISVEEPFGFVFEIERLGSKRQNSSMALHFRNLDIFTYEILEKPKKVIKLKRILTMNQQIYPKVNDNYVFQNSQSKIPEILLVCNKQSTKEKNEEIKLSIKENFQKDIFYNPKDLLDQIQDSKSEPYSVDPGQYEQKQTPSFREKYEKFYQEINKEYQANTTKTHVKGQIIAVLPYVCLEIDLDSLKLLERFQQIMLIHLERLDQGRTLISKTCMQLEKEKETVNPFVVWINEVKNNMFIELRIRELAINVCNSTSINPQDPFLPTQSENYECFYRSNQKKYMSLTLLGTFVATRIHMDSKMIDPLQKKDKLNSNVIAVVKDMILIDPNQCNQIRDSIFRKKNINYPEEEDISLINIQSFSLPNYLQYTCLMFSEGIQSPQLHHPPCLSLVFDFSVNQTSNLQTLGRTITKNIDLRYLKFQDVNIRTGDFRFKFLNNDPHQTENSLIYDQLDYRLKKRQRQMAVATRIQNNIGIIFAFFNHIQIHVQQVYNVDSMSQNQKLKNYLMRKTIQTKLLDLNQTQDVNQNTFKITEEVYFGDVQFVIGVKEIKLSMLNQRNHDKSEAPESTMLEIQTSIKSLVVAALIDDQIYKDSRQFLKIKDSCFPYMIFQNSSRHKSNTTMFTDSYLEKLGFTELFTLSKLYTTFSNCQRTRYKSNTKILTLNTEIINGYIGIKDLEPLYLMKEFLIERFKDISQRCKSPQMQQLNRQPEAQDEEADDEAKRLQFSLGVLVDQMQEDTNWYQEIDDDTCVFIAEDVRWKRKEYFGYFEEIEQTARKRDFFLIFVELEAVNIQLSNKSYFQFHPLSNYDFEIVDSPTKEQESLIKFDLQKQQIQDYLNQEVTKFQVQELRRRIPSDPFKSLSLIVGEARFRFIKIEPSTKLQIHSLSDIQCSIKDVQLTLHLNVKSQIQDVTLLSKVYCEDQQERDEFIEISLNIVERQKEFEFIQVSIQLNQNIQLKIQNSLMDIYKGIRIEETKINQGESEEWLNQNKEQMQHLIYIYQKLMESNYKEMFNQTNHVIKQEQKQKKKYIAKKFQIREFELSLSLMAESLKLSEFSKLQLMNLKNFENIKLKLVQINLNDQELGDQFVKLLMTLYLTDIKQNYQIILDFFKQIPLVSEFVSASQGLYQLIVYPILYPWLGKGFVDGLHDGVRGFMISLAEIGSSIGNMFTHGTQQIVSITKGR